MAALAICLVAVLFGSASQARADSLTQLPAGLNDPWMVVDPGDQHVFVSSGHGGSQIVVLDFSGAIVGTITGEPGATQMAVNPATHTLYAALKDANAISEIDTQTLTEKARFSTLPFQIPYSLVIAGGELWFSDNVGYNHGYVASMNLDGSDLKERTQDLAPGQPTSLYMSVELSAGGANNHLLATAQPSGGITLYDVSGGTVTPQNGPLGDPGGFCGNLGDFSVTPSADYVLYISPCQNHAVALATDLNNGASFDYPAGYGGPGAVAASPDGQYVATGAGSGPVSAPTIQIFPKNSSQPAWGWAEGVAPHSLAFSPDGLHLFALVGYGGGLAFQVLDRYTAPDTKITGGPTTGSTTYNTSASFSFASDNAPVTFECNLDGGGWTACSSPKNVGGLLPGSHSFSVRSVAGTQIDSVGQTRTWTVQPPNTEITSGPSDPSFSSSATFAFASDDANPLTYMCKLDAAAARQCFSPTTYTKLAMGTHTFEVRAQDGSIVSDADPVGASRTWTIVPAKESLAVSKSGKGTVKSSPSGISCGITCKHTYAYGAAVTLTATSAVGSAFVGWSGACTGVSKTCQLSMTASLAATATFAPLKLLTVVKAGTGSGTVTSSPAGISCGSTCTHKFAAGTVVTLSASAAPGSTFAGWSGACSGTGDCVVTVSAAKSVSAQFSR